MKPPLRLKRLPVHKRVMFAIIALICISVGLIAIILPITHLTRELLTGNVALPLVLFTCLATPFGILFIYIGLQYRVWVFPYEFTVDYLSKTCGYQWNDNWFKQKSISGACAIVATAHFTPKLLGWSILVRFKDSSNPLFIYNTPSSPSSEMESFKTCYETSSKIADYLEIDVEFDGWSNEVLDKNHDKTNLMKQIELG